MNDHRDDQGDASDSRSVDARFVERISIPLRATERLPDDFEMRVMAAAHADASGTSRKSVPSSRYAGWWRRPRTLTVSPLAGMALAAGLVGIALLGEAVMRSVLRSGATSATASVAPAPSPSALHDTVHVVRFIFVAPNAKSIALVGDFNQWAKETATFARTPNGKAWVISVPLPPGRHEYAFLVKDAAGEHWIADPTAPSVSDEFGTESSLVEVGGNATDRAGSAS